MRKRFVQSLIILLLAAGSFAVPRIHTVAAVGNVYVSPASIAPLPVGSTSDPQTISVNISNLNNTLGHPLLPGQSILLSTKLSYSLDKTSQSFSSYPRIYTDTATATAWTKASYAGTQATATGSASFVAHAKVLGDMNGDGRVDILDVGMILAAYGSTPSSPNWNPNADFNSEGSVGIDDVSIALAYYDTSS